MSRKWIAQFAAVAVLFSTLVGASTMVIAPAAQALGANSITVVDDLNNFAKTYARSSVDNWQVDSTSASTYFEGDTGRAARLLTNTPEWLSWSYSNISTFSVRVYYAETPVLNDVSFYSSIDGITWSTVTVTGDTPVSTAGGWARVNFSPSTTLPTGTNFIKVQLANDTRIWAPQISKVSITYTDSTMIYDELNDWSKTFSHSANWRFDSTSASLYFNGDTSRATRTTDTPENIVYQSNNLEWFSARVYFVSSFSGEVVLSTSPDGSTWSTLSASNTTPIATTGGWLYTDFSASAAIPSGTNYLKIQFQNESRIWAPQLASVHLAGGAPNPNPRVMTTTLSSQDVPVAMYSVTDFGAVANDSVDATGAFQAALNAAETAGGGVVFAPAGTYQFYGHLNVPVNVTLRGDWASPEVSGSGVGTILEPHADRDSSTGIAFITTHDASTVRDLSIWYPDQNDIANIHAYPYAIAASNTTIYGPTLENLTLYNSYQAFNLYLAAATYDHNIFATALKQGIMIDRIGDISRFDGVNFRPKYWANSTLGSPPTEAAIMTYTRANATGVTIGKNDWGYVYDLYLEGYNIGLLLQSSSWNASDGSHTGAYNGQIQKLHTENGRIGIQINQISPLGITVSNSAVNTNGTDGISVYAPSTYASGQTVSFNNTSFSSPSGKPIELDGGGAFSFVHDSFPTWSSSNKAITATAGTVIVESSTFSVNQPDISLGAGVVSAAVVANSYALGTPNITNASTGDIKINTDPTLTPSFSPSMPAGDPVVGTYRKPSTNNLWNVKTSPFNAAGDGVTNDTSAFQSALNAASSGGGGTVYVPAGRYNIAGHLSVPTGVELRGVSDGPHHYGEDPRGTVLLASESQGNASGTPFISLAMTSGIRGLSVFYPNQNYSTVSAYPTTIQGNGTDDYVIDVTMPDSYLAIKMTAGGYYVNYARGLGLSEFIDLSGITSVGYIDNIMNTVGDWQDINRESNAPPQNWWQSAPSFYGVGVNINNSNNVNLFDTFTFGVGYGVRISGTSSNITAYGHGTDNAEHSIELTGSGTGINFINTQMTAIGSAGSKRYIYTSTGFTGKASFFNAAGWASTSGIELDGSGSVTLVQYLDNPQSGGTPLRQYGGTLTMHAASFNQTGTQVYLDAGIVDAFLYANAGLGGFGVTNNKGALNVWLNILR